MRPLALELEGFATFRDRTTIDFADLDLVALVGPTGSGKSTVIDAITFALYGSVARYDNPNLVAPVIHQLSTEARVRFDFELAGQIYRAVRIVRRTKPTPGGAPRATTKEARLEVLADDGSSTVLAGSVSELDAEVQNLIGLDFNQFTRTIVLPQGDFADFLKDDPGNRQKLLRRLLDLDVYARMGARAREQAGEAGRWATMREEELGRLADVSPERLVTAQTGQARVTGFAAALPDRLGELATVEAELTARRDEVGTIDRSLSALDQVAVPEQLRSVDEVTSQARQELAQATQAVNTAQAARTDALAAVDEAPNPASVRELLHHRQHLDEATEAMAGLEAELATAQVAGVETATAVADAEQAAERATNALRLARSTADAAGWVSQLRAGEPCPICQQDVHEVPSAHGAEEMVAAERQAAETRKALSAATAGAARAEGRLASLEADRAQRAKAVADLSATLSDAPDQATLAEQLTRAVAAAATADATSNQLRKAERAAAQANAAVAEAQEAESRFQGQFTSQRDTLIDLSPPAPANQSLSSDWQSLTRWAGERADGLRRDRQSVAEKGKQAATAKASLIEALATDAQAAGLDPRTVATDPTGLTAAVAASAARLMAEIEALGEKLQRKHELQAEVTRLGERRQVLDSLGRQHLSAAGFERWLLAEALDDLVARATTRLLELSDGRYSLEAVDGSFAVRDHGNADERRDIRTLSGGEVFLASLALALALADSIAELATVDGPRLESIFLDEGFGTLDGETLDILAGAIEELSATGRLVVIVTHVRELAERMPVRFEVRKGPTTSTVERVEG